MVLSQYKQRRGCVCRVISALLVVIFSSSLILPPSVVQAQIIPTLPPPGTMVMASPHFVPVLLKGIQPDPQNPLQFTFFFNTGDVKESDEALRADILRLIRYFMAALTVPEDQLWVNLSPYEAGRIVSDSLGATEMGIDLLAQDYMLKQLTASLLYPENELGQKFWKRVQQQAQARFGRSDISLEVLNKVWITPNEAVVYEHNGAAYVVKSSLKVLLEQDYMGLEANSLQGSGPNGSLSNEGQAMSPEMVSIIKEIVIPEIEREINQGETFAQLRQVYQSMILATWFKLNLRQTLLGQVYADQQKVKGIDLADPAAPEEVYNRYLEGFQKGVYEFIREDYDEATHRVIPRKYFSGGVVVPKDFNPKRITGEPATLSPADRAVVRAGLASNNGGDGSARVGLVENGNPESLEAARRPKGTDGAMIASRVDLTMLNPRTESSAVDRALVRAGGVVAGVTAYDDQGRIAAAPVLVGDDIQQKMQGTAIMIDVSIDQGGNIRHRLPDGFKYSHSTPAVKNPNGQITEGVPNMLAAMGQLATPYLSEARQPYLIALIKMIQAVRDGREFSADDAVLRTGLKKGFRFLAGENLDEQGLSPEELDRKIRQGFEPIAEGLRRGATLTIGVPAEILQGERRFGITPVIVQDLQERFGDEIQFNVERGGGALSEISDGEFPSSVNMVSAAGAWNSDIVLKIKQPLSNELHRFREDGVIFTYYHLENRSIAESGLKEALVGARSCAIAYESVRDEAGGTPLLNPMSHIAGWLASMRYAVYQGLIREGYDLFNESGVLRSEAVSEINRRLKPIIDFIAEGDHFDRLKRHELVITQDVLAEAGIPRDIGEVVFLGAGHVGREAAHMFVLLGGIKMTVTETNPARQASLAEDLNKVGDRVARDHGMLSQQFELVSGPIRVGAEDDVLAFYLKNRDSADPAQYILEVVPHGRREGQFIFKYALHRVNGHATEWRLSKEGAETATDMFGIVSHGTDEERDALAASWPQIIDELEQANGGRVQVPSARDAGMISARIGQKQDMSLRFDDPVLNKLMRRVISDKSGFVVSDVSLEAMLSELDQDGQIALFRGGLGFLAGETFGAYRNGIGVMPLYHQNYKGKQIDWRHEKGIHVVTVDGKELKLAVELAGKTYETTVFWVNRKGTPVFLFENKEIFHQLYPDPMTGVERMRQYAFLGKAYVALMNALELRPDILRLNEAQLMFVQRAIELDRADKGADSVFGGTRTVMTNHTPEKAALPRFSRYVEGAGRMWYPLEKVTGTDMVSSDMFASDGQINAAEWLGRRSVLVTAVSEEHAEVTKRFVLPQLSDHITGIQNGSDPDEWQSPELNALMKKVGLEGVTGEDLWRFRQQQKTRLNEWLARHGAGGFHDVNRPLFSAVRRLVTYKAQGILVPLVEWITGDPGREYTLPDGSRRNGLGANLLVGGPVADTMGEEWAREFRTLAQDERFRGKLVFVEGTGKEMMQLAASAPDGWLVMPRLTREASGTGDQRAGFNGAIVIATATGGPLAWVEDGKNGWLVDPLGTTTTKTQDGEYELGDAFNRVALILDNPDHPEHAAIVARFEREAQGVFADRMSRIVMMYRAYEAGRDKRILGFMKGSFQSAMEKVSIDRMMSDYQRLFREALKHGQTSDTLGAASYEIQQISATEDEERIRRSIQLLKDSYAGLAVDGNLSQLFKGRGPIRGVIRDIAGQPQVQGGEEEARVVVVAAWLVAHFDLRLSADEFRMLVRGIMTRQDLGALIRFSPEMQRHFYEDAESLLNEVIPGEENIVKVEEGFTRGESLAHILTRQRLARLTLKRAWAKLRARHETRSEGTTLTERSIDIDVPAEGQKTAPGGIDLNSAYLDLKIERDGQGVPLPMSEQPVDLIQQIEGFAPVLIDMTPIPGVLMLLGMDQQGSGTVVGPMARAE